MSFNQVNRESGAKGTGLFGTLLPTPPPPPLPPPSLSIRMTGNEGVRKEGEDCPPIPPPHFKNVSP